MPQLWPHRKSMHSLVCLLVSKMPLLFNGNGYLKSVSSSFIDILFIYMLQSAFYKLNFKFSPSSKQRLRKILPLNNATYMTKVAFVESKLIFPLLHFVIPKKLLRWTCTVHSPLFGHYVVQLLSSKEDHISFLW